jgi:biotin operon repressor
VEAPVTRTDTDTEPLTTPSQKRRYRRAPNFIEIQSPTPEELAEYGKRPRPEDPDKDITDRIAVITDMVDRLGDRVTEEEYKVTLAMAREGWDAWDMSKRMREALQDEVIEVFDELVKSNNGRSPTRVITAREAFADSVWEDDLLDMPSIDEPIWGKDDHQLWTPGDPGHLWGTAGSYKTGAFGIPLAAFRSGAAQDALGHSDLWGYPVKPTDGSVVYLAWDRERQIKKVAARYSRYLRKDLHEYIDFIGLTSERRESLLGNSENFIDWLLDREADTVFVDSLQNVIGTEYRPEALQQYLDFLKLCSKAGIETQTINHAIKASFANGKPTPPTFRGAQVVMDQMGTSLNIKRRSDEDEFAYIVVEMDKASVETVPPIRLKLTKETGHPEPDDDPAQVMDFSATPTSSPGRKRGENRIHEVALYIENADGPVSNSKIREAIKMSPNNVQMYVSQLREGGHIERDNGGWVSVNAYPAS